MEIEMDSSALQQHHHHQHQQEMSSQTLESMLVCTKAQQEKKPRPPEQALKCPRCDSSNTKFCYYNNYSLTQPRYFCKSCRRYWTKGGTLRNVPVGGGCRKNKRSSSSSSSTTTTTTPTPSTASSSLSSKIRSQDQLPLLSPSNNPSGLINPLLSSLAHLPYHDSTTDLSLAFARLHSQASSPAVGQLGFESPDLVLGGSASDHIFLGNPQSNSTTHGFLEALQRGGFFEGTPTTHPNGFHHQNHGFYGGNIGNGETGTGVENGETHHGMMGGGGIGCHEELEMGMNNNMISVPLFHQQHNNSASTTTGAATTAAVTVTTVKQESSHSARSASEVSAQGQENRVLWGFPWQIGGENGNNTNSMVHHELDSGRQILGTGWNGLGSTNWQGLLNSPLM